IPGLPVAQRLDLRVVARPLDSAVPTAIVVAAVPVALAVLLVAFFVVGDEIVQGEAIVAGDEIHALLRLALLVPVDLRTAEEPVRDAAHRPPFAPEKIAYVVAEAAVPLFPGISREAPHLIESHRIPSLGDQLH